MARLDQGLMGMPEHYRRKARVRRLEIELRNLMQHEETALADLHRTLAVGAAAHLVLRAGVESGYLADDDFPGRLVEL